MDHSKKLLIIVIASILGLTLLILHVQSYILLSQQKADIAQTRSESKEQVEICNAALKQQEQKTTLLRKNLDELKEQWNDEKTTLLLVMEKKEKLAGETKRSVEALKQELEEVKNNLSSLTTVTHDQNSDMRNDIKIILKEMQAAKIMELRNKTIALEASLIELGKRIDIIAPPNPNEKKLRLSPADYN